MHLTRKKKEIFTFSPLRFFIHTTAASLSPLDHEWVAYAYADLLSFRLILYTLCFPQLSCASCHATTLRTVECRIKARPVHISVMNLVKLSVCTCNLLSVDTRDIIFSTPRFTTLKFSLSYLTCKFEHLWKYINGYRWSLSVWLSYVTT